MLHTYTKNMLKILPNIQSIENNDKVYLYEMD